MITAQLVKRALAAGYTALAVTVDTPVLGRREADMRNRFKLPDHLTMGNFVSQGGAHASGTKDGGNDSVRDEAGPSFFCVFFFDSKGPPTDDGMANARGSVHLEALSGGLRVAPSRTRKSMI